MPLIKSTAQLCTIHDVAVPTGTFCATYPFFLCFTYLRKMHGKIFVMKSKECRIVLQLMDQDVSYSAALKVAMKHTNKTKPEIEKELDKYI
jgi:hypothetical protein